MRVALWLRQLPGTLKPQQLAHNALWCLGGLVITTSKPEPQCASRE